MLYLNSHDYYDLKDLLGDLNLEIHFSFGQEGRNERIKLTGTLLKISTVFSRYTPLCTELIDSIMHLRELILEDNTSEINTEPFMVLYDSFVKDISSFIEHAHKIGISKENRHLVYSPTYIGINQLITLLTNNQEDGNDVEFF